MKKDQISADELIETLAAALSADSAIVQWSQAQFGKTHTVYIDINEGNPPPKEEYPVIAIIGCTELGGIGKNASDWYVEVGSAIINENIYTSDNLKTHVGFIQAARLAQLVRRAVLSALTNIYREVTFEERHGQTSEYPLFMSFSQFVLQQARRAGSPRY